MIGQPQSWLTGVGTSAVVALASGALLVWTSSQCSAKQESDYRFSRVKMYFHRNPGTILIAAFQILLIVLAALLLTGLTDLASKVAVYAFDLLIVGVLIQVIIVIRSKRD